MNLVWQVWVPTVRGSSCTFPALSGVRSVEFHPKDRKLVTATDDKAVKLWSIDTKRFSQSFLGHTNRVNCARYSPSGKTVASCSDDRTLKVFDVNSGECVQTFAERGNVHGEISIDRKFEQLNNNHYPQLFHKFQFQ